MKQPNYKFADRVKFKTLLVSSNWKSINKKVELTGIVCGISYDPANGTTGWPYYNYTILVDDCGGKAFGVSENELKSIEEKEK